MNNDNEYLMSLFEQELAFIRDNWPYSGRPTLVVMLTHAMMESAIGIDTAQQPFFMKNDGDRIIKPMTRNRGRNVLNFMMALRTGICNGVRVRLGHLSEMVRTSYIESLDFLVHKNDVDWWAILRGCHTAAKRPDVLSAPSSRSRRRSTTRSRSRSRLTSPVLEPRETLNVTASALVNGVHKHMESSHNSDATLEQQSANVDAASAASDDSSVELEMISLTLGDPNSVPQAIEHLERSSNIFDQIGKQLQVRMTGLTHTILHRSIALSTFMLWSRLLHRVIIMHCCLST
jgi:phosphorylase kinase alpha/beta subunit